MANIKYADPSTYTNKAITDSDKVMVRTAAGTDAIGSIVQPKGQIDGLKMEWVSPSQIRVTSGSAYVPGAERIAELAAAVTLTPSIGANAWGHVYLLVSGTTVGVEAVTTAPASAYYGTARAKTGDTSRRYIGSFRTNASSQIIRFIHDASSQSVNYVVDLNTPPLLLVSGGTTANPSIGASVSCSNAVPVTGRRMYAFTENTGTNIVFVSIPELGAPNSNILFFLRAAAMVSGVVVINDNKEFSYSTGTGAVFQCYCTGYTYER